MRLNEEGEDKYHSVLKSLIEAYNCRICKVKLTEDNFGGLGSNHMIFCKDCKNFG